MDLIQDSLTARVRRLRVIWGAMLLGVATFYLVVWFLIKSERAVPAQPFLDSGLLTIVGVIVAAGLLVAPLVRRQLERAPRGADAEEIARRWEIGWICGQAIKETVGILGLAIALMAASTAWALGFTVASVASMIMTPPWEAQLRRRIQSETGSAATSL